MLILDVVGHSETLSQPMLIGSHMTLDTTAMGRAYLAACSVGERRRIIDHLVKHRNRSSTELEEIVRQAQAEYGARGYCTSVNAWREGVNGVAVPLFLRNFGRRILLTCGGSAAQMPESAIHDRIGPLLVKVAGDLERQSTSLTRI
ncbi:IclR family transcriptional regulator C-terminal domain-containing protein [Cupriavidus sp. L7L]|uniref:IclR family transcriptional regulator domain-containing protein n=1 Tax=Cupriavidus sp. L7L TaxID=2546443 RepID=UPI001FB6FD69|nr:IclR family transcriptional regulator C-terminal domain-containing protein [Cupriavidus sp. L7L]